MDDRFFALRTATETALLERAGATPPELRQSIAHGTPPADLAPLVERIRRQAHTVTDRDIDDLRTRYTEDQLFEIILCAAFGAASARLSAGLRALEEA